MARNNTTRELEARVRSSRAYGDWVTRHKSSFCLSCGSSDNLECHHVVELYHVVLGLWKLYGNKEDVFEHAVIMHERDICEAVTLCRDCHKQTHTGRQPKRKADVRSEEWSAVPRSRKFVLAHSTRDRRPGALGLVGAQTLFGLGWYVLNGQMDSRIVEFDRKQLARLLGKSPCSSFYRSLDRALGSLEEAGVLLASHQDGSDVEAHMSPDYLDDMAENPWFVPLADIRTHRVCVLALKWFLGTQSKRRTYKIGLSKLCGHLGVRTRHLPMAAKAVRSACDDIPWAGVEIEKGMCSFELKKKGAVPIFSLRESLSDSVEYGR